MLIYAGSFVVVLHNPQSTKYNSHPGQKQDEITRDSVYLAAD